MQTSGTLVQVGEMATQNSEGLILLVQLVMLQEVTQVGVVVVLGQFSKPQPLVHALLQVAGPPGFQATLPVFVV